MLIEHKVVQISRAVRGDRICLPTVAPEVQHSGRPGDWRVRSSSQAGGRAWVSDEASTARFVVSVVDKAEMEAFD